MSLTTPSKLRELQIKLYRKAKNEASTGAIARHQPLQSKWYSANWGKCSSAESGSNLVRESAVKPVGKPDAGNPHVRFDERGWETGRRSGVSARAHPRLYKVAQLPGSGDRADRPKSIADANSPCVQQPDRSSTRRAIPFALPLLTFRNSVF